MNPLNAVEQINPPSRSIARKTLVPSAALELEMWRAASRRSTLSDFAAEMARGLRGTQPFTCLTIWAIDASRSCIEALVECTADGSSRRSGAAGRVRIDVAESYLAEILAWARHDAPTPVADAADSIVPEVADGAGGRTLVGPLRAADGQPIGLLALTLPPGEDASRADLLLRVVLDPAGAALAADRRLRETTALREAAEADRVSLLNRLGRDDISETIVGASGGLREVMERVELVTRSDVPVLLLGETGSGKEVVARAIHSRSGRAKRPFLRVNCGAIPPELIDSELFGHDRGSFTGATSLRKGWFERADGGTLFLDEIGELPAAAQVRLLRILQDGSFERVGGQQQLSVDVRVVAATHRDLHAMVTARLFREDLWYRVAVFPIRLPPLRERPQDVAPLAAHFARKAARRFGTPVQLPSPIDIELLLAYPWPGNVRELAAVIDRATILGDGNGLAIATALGIHDTPKSVPIDRDDARQAVEAHLALAARRTSADPIETLDAAMAAHIQRALRATNGRIEGDRGAARLLGINPHTLRGRMRKLKIQWRSFRPQRAAEPT